MPGKQQLKLQTG